MSKNFYWKADAEVSRQIRKLIDKKMLVPEKEGTRKYVLRFDNSYLLRSVIKSLGEKDSFQSTMKSYRSTVGQDCEMFVANIKEYRLADQKFCFLTLESIKSDKSQGTNKFQPHVSALENTNLGLYTL